jgi:hypothetical protein
MGPADQDPRPESADRETGGQAGGHDRVADQRDDLASQRTDQADQRDDRADQREDLADQREHAADTREARIDQLMRGSGVSTESVHQRAQEAITRSRQLIARSAAAMDRFEALLRRQVQRASQEQSATDRETARSRRDAGP